MNSGTEISKQESKRVRYRLKRGGTVSVSYQKDKQTNTKNLLSNGTQEEVIIETKVSLSGPWTENLAFFICVSRIERKRDNPYKNNDPSPLNTQFHLKM